MSLLQESDAAVSDCVLRSWGGSSVGRALRSQCRGRGFNSLPLHFTWPVDTSCQRVLFFDGARRSAVATRIGPIGGDHRRFASDGPNLTRIAACWCKRWLSQKHAATNAPIAVLSPSCPPSRRARPYSSMNQSLSCVRLLKSSGLRAKSLRAFDESAMIRIP